MFMKKSTSNKSFAVWAVEFISCYIIWLYAESFLPKRFTEAFDALIIDSSPILHGNGASFVMKLTLFARSLLFTSEINCPNNSSLRPARLPVPYESAVSNHVTPLLMTKSNAFFNDSSCFSSYPHRNLFPHAHVPQPIGLMTREPTFMGPDIGFKVAVIATERNNRRQKKIAALDENIIGFW